MKAPVPAPVAAKVPVPAAPKASAPLDIPAPPKASASKLAPVPAPSELERGKAARVASLPKPAPAPTLKDTAVEKELSGELAPPKAESSQQCQGQGIPGQTEAYIVELGQYATKLTLEDAKKRAQRSGIAYFVEQGPKHKEPMTRVHIGEYANQQAAKKTLDKLRAVNAEHFVLQDKTGKLNIYAGSFADPKAALKEQQRFASLGIKSNLKQVMVSVPTYQLSAGCFLTEEAARKKVAELDKLGFKSVVVKKSP